VLSRSLQLVRLSSGWQGSAMFTCDIIAALNYVANHRDWS